MEKRLGKRIFAAPFIVVIVIGCIFCLVIAPITKLDPRDLPFAIVSQDEGITTPAGSINVGDMIVEKIISDENDESSTIAWTKLNADSDVEDVMKSGDYFAAIVIPKDFSQKMMAARAGAAGVAGATAAAVPNAAPVVIATPESLRWRAARQEHFRPMPCSARRMAARPISRPSTSSSTMRGAR